MASFKVVTHATCARTIIVDRILKYEQVALFIPRGRVLSTLTLRGGLTSR